MEKFTKLTAVAAPMDVANVDTDQLIPKQFLKRTEKDGYGQFLFYNWRFLADGSLNPAFILNQEPYDKARILVAGENFGCGSSREHAPWALAGFGIRAVIAPSFADIFRNNCVSNGLLTIAVEKQLVDELLKRIPADKSYRLTIDLGEQTVSASDGFAFSFGVDPAVKKRLMEGLDAIDLTLAKEDKIAKYEAVNAQPWRAAAIRQQA